jgi:hypothetical protein
MERGTVRFGTGSYELPVHRHLVQMCHRSTEPIAVLRCDLFFKARAWAEERGDLARRTLSLPLRTMSREERTGVAVIPLGDECHGQERVCGRRKRNTRLRVMDSPRWGARNLGIRNAANANTIVQTMSVEPYNVVSTTALLSSGSFV